MSVKEKLPLIHNEIIEAISRFNNTIAQIEQKYGVDVLIYSDDNMILSHQIIGEESVSDLMPEPEVAPQKVVDKILAEAKPRTKKKNAPTQESAFALQAAFPPIPESQKN